MKSQCYHRVLLKVLTASLFVAVVVKGTAQTKDINYLGQKAPGLVAQVFAPGIISTDSFEHSAPAFSPDGKMVLWTVIPAKMGQPSYSLQMNYENGKWSAPQRASFHNNIAGDVYPSFSIDGSRLYFSSERESKDTPPVHGNRIWQVERNKESWGIPMPVDPEISQGNDYGHSVTSDGTFYISGGRQGSGNWNIKRCKKGNALVWLPYGINGIGYEDGPFIAPDESYLIFESQRAEGTDGSLDLYISFRSKNGGWQLPVNMGPKINTAASERFARVSPDGKYLFFGSTRNRTASNRGFDIFWIDAAIIDELKKANADAPVIDVVAGTKIISAMEQSQWQEAAELLRQWVTAYPSNLSGTIDYSAVLRRLSRYAEAADLLARKATLFKGNISFTMELALIKFGLNRDKEAVALLDPLLQNKEQLWDRCQYIHTALFEMGKYTQSDIYFEKAMTIYPNGFHYYRRASAYAGIKDMEKAFSLLYKAVGLGQNSLKAYEEDPALEVLRKDARWNTLREKLK